VNDHGLQRVRRSLGEMLLIVISILLAFALDSWRDEREAHEQVEQELAAVRQELLDNIANANGVLQSVRKHAANVDLLIAALERAEGEPVIVPNEWLGSLVTWRTTDFSTGTLELMKASGGLRRIHDPQLRSALASFQADLLDFTEDEEIGRDFAEFEFSPMLARQGLGAVAWRHRLGFREELQGGETEVVPTEELLGMLQARRVHWWWSETGLPGVTAYMQQLATGIDDYLAGRPVTMPSREEAMRPEDQAP